MRGTGEAGPARATLSSPPRPDLSAWEARPLSRSYNAPFSRSDRRSRRSRSLLFFRVRGWGAAPESGIWAEAGRNPPRTKKGVGVSFGGGSPLSPPARRVPRYPHEFLTTEAAPDKRPVKPNQADTPSGPELLSGRRLNKTPRPVPVGSAPGPAGTHGPEAVLSQARAQETVGRDATEPRPPASTHFGDVWVLHKGQDRNIPEMGPSKPAHPWRW